MMFLYRIYQYLIMIPVMVVATIITATVITIGCFLGLGKWFGYKPAIIWARLFCVMTGVKVTVTGRENIDSKTSYVFVANHQGAYDIFSIYGYLGHEFRWMMKKELRSIPFAGYACKASGQIFVDDSSPRAIVSTMKEASERLKHGMSLVVFPEGARTPDGRLHEFKSGAFRLAKGFGLPVVPITIDGSYHVMSRTAKSARPGHIKLTIHKPIYPGPNGHDQKQLMEESRRAIASALPEEL